GRGQRRAFFGRARHLDAVSDSGRPAPPRVRTETVARERLHAVVAQEIRRRRLMRRGYLIFGVAVLTLYTLAEASGWQMASPRKQILPADVRQSPGGYRSFHFWHA